MDFNVFNDYIEEILDILCIDYRNVGTKYVAKCPIHDSRQNKLAIYKSGVWQCFTRGCENEWGHGIIGFARGVLNERDNLNLDFIGTVKWLCQNLNIPYSGSKPSKEVIDKKKFIGQVHSLVKDVGEIEYTKISKDIIKKRLEIPSKYFIRRGFSPKLLTEYYIGDCLDKSKPFYNRAVVPILNCDEHAIGFLARSFFDKCSKCGVYHNPQESCPFFPQPMHEKWINSKFNKSHILFNFWNAEKYIEQTSSVIIVESVGDILKLEEAEIRNSVGVLGSSLNPPQKLLLEKLPITELILLLNNDEAGKKGQKQIIEECGKIYNIRCPKLEKNDLGEMSIDEIRGLLL